MQGQATYIALVYVSTRCWQILRLPYQGWEKPVFFKKKQPTSFFVFFFKKSVTFLGFLKSNKILFFFQRKQKNHILNCFYSIMQYPYFQNYTIICYTYYAINIEGEAMYPIFDFAMCCWSVHS